MQGPLLLDFSPIFISHFALSFVLGHEAGTRGGQEEEP